MGTPAGQQPGNIARQSGFAAFWIPCSAAYRATQPTRDPERPHVTSQFAGSVEQALEREVRDGDGWILQRDEPIYRCARRTA